MNNLWSDPSVADVKQDLLDKLLEWHMESQIHTHDWAADWR